MDDYGIQAAIYGAGRTGLTENGRRSRCLEAMLNDAARHQEERRIVVDRDESLVSLTAR